MSATCWTSPGGLYVVPDDFRIRFLREFPDYRIRWSLTLQRWQLEQRCGRGALPPIRISPEDDGLIRARDGYWLVMAFQPGNRMACPSVVTRFPDRQTCGMTLPVASRRSAESVCPSCKAHGRDGRHMVAYWPFDELLLDHLRYSDPLRDGTRRQRLDADARNAARKAALEADVRDAKTSLDAVDYRWLAGIASSTGIRRQVDASTFR